MSNDLGGRGGGGGRDQVLSGYWGVESITVSGGNGLQAAIHRVREREGGGGG